MKRVFASFSCLTMGTYSIYVYWIIICIENTQIAYKYFKYKLKLTNSVQICLFLGIGVSTQVPCRRTGRHNANSDFKFASK